MNFPHLVKNLKSVATTACYVAVAIVIVGLVSTAGAATLIDIFDIPPF